MAGSKIKTKLKKGVIFFLRIFALILLTLFCYQYFMSQHYNYAKPLPFTGDSIYNPYASLKSRWLKSNFHAHSISWLGLTNGAQTSDSIISHYKKDLKYDVACLSNYERHTHYFLEDSAEYLPVYEHGYNIIKVHQVILGKCPVMYYDIFLFQSLDNKQYMINQEKKISPVVAVVHPEVRNAYSNSDLKKLSGYDLIEVLNNFRNAEASWDIALTAGRLPWIIADDDSHDISLPNETGAAWTMVNTDTKNGSEVLDALRSGRAYGVSGTNGINDHYLKEVKVSGNTVSFFVDTPASEIKLIGQNGVVKKIASNIDSILYTFQPDDNYIRTVIKFPSLTMLLNPLVRYDGKNIPSNTNTSIVNPQSTFFMRLFIFLIWVLGVVLINKPGWLFSKLGMKRKRANRKEFKTSEVLID
jgi:hypothetical protein